MTWVVKEEDGTYLTESPAGVAYFSEKQRDAKRFTDQGRAYRVCMRWGCDRVVKLVPKRKPDEIDELGAWLQLQPSLLPSTPPEPKP